MGSGVFHSFTLFLPQVDLSHDIYPQKGVLFIEKVPTLLRENELP